MSAVVETALGLCLVFYLTALFTAGAVEWCASIVNKRAKALLVGIQEMLDPTEGEPIRAKAQPKSLVRASLSAGHLDRAALGARVANERPSRVIGWLRAWSGWTAPSSEGLNVTDVMRHSLVQPFKTTRFGTGKTRNPSYLPADIFATALLDLAATKQIGGAQADSSMTELAKRLGWSGDGEGLTESLRALAKAADGKTDELIKGIESWYTAQMDRVTGAYKRWAKRVGVVVAVAVVGVLHIDALAITSSLWADGALRASVAASADVAGGCRQTDGTRTPAECALAELDAWGLAGLPIGFQEWSRRPSDAPGWGGLLVGFGLSIAATSMGAPFWFATMNRLVNIRNTGNPPKEAQS
nr:hypothetical protein [Propionicimonas sp.]